MAKSLREKILKWYAVHQRQLPWRIATPDAQSNPYHTWLSEVMLQQTTVVTVKPYFLKFIEKWPTVEDLAAASLDEVLTQWQGLGYYSRARNLHHCANMIAAECQGQFPSDVSKLKALPGIGSYTSAAIAAIAFSKAVVPVDGNVIRVFARLFGYQETLPTLLDLVSKKAEEFSFEKNSGEFAQALMDLGATVCKPKSPNCQECPLVKDCYAYQNQCAETLPRKAPKPIKPVRKTIAFLMENPQGQIALRKRPIKGMLGGMMELPSTPWSKAHDDSDNWRYHLPAKGHWQKLDGEVKHTFSHFHLVAEVWFFKGDCDDEALCWVHQEDLPHYPLPTVIKKMVSLYAANKEAIGL